MVVPPMAGAPPFVNHDGDCPREGWTRARSEMPSSNLKLLGIGHEAGQTQGGKGWEPELRLAVGESASNERKGVR